MPLFITHSCKRVQKFEHKMFMQAEKEIAQARMDIAHEVRLAKEAEAAMDLHVSKAGERAEQEIGKHASTDPNAKAALNASNSNNNHTYTDTGM
jgi:head-tail adaptor